MYCFCSHFMALISVLGSFLLVNLIRDLFVFVSCFLMVVGVCYKIVVATLFC